MWICGCHCSAKENGGGTRSPGAAVQPTAGHLTWVQGTKTQVLWETKSHLSSLRMFIFNDNQLQLGDAAQLAECWASRHEALSSVPPNTVQTACNIRLSSQHSEGRITQEAEV